MNTLKMIEILFPETEHIDMKYVADIIEVKCVKMGLNTNLRVAHFLAQVREEVGPKLKAIEENLNYSEKALISIFRVFRNNPELAEMYGRDEDSVADPVKIANFAYANRNGNGDPDSDGDGDIDENDDGYRYRGAGCLQITGKANFVAVQKRIDKYVVGESVNILDGKGIFTIKGAILSAAGYWIWKDLYRSADRDDVDGVTKIINFHTKSYSDRRKHYNKIKHLV